MHHRLLSLAEFQYNISFSATHIPGKPNAMTDAGSRAWGSTHSLYSVWFNLSSCSSRITIHQSLKCLGSMLRRNTMASSTIAKYHQYWRQWFAFAQQMMWSRWLSPANAFSRIPFRHTGHRLKYFATHLWPQGWNTADRGNRHSTILLKLSGIRWFHRRHKNVLPNSPRLELSLAGIKRLSAPRRKKQPLTPSFLRLLHRSLNPNRPRQRVVRISENWEGLSFHCLNRRNAFFSDGEGRRTSYKLATTVTVGLEGAKNDQFGRVS
ncbi:hypothetical protein PHMEG_0004118 [Phytophthora megakarya]|uniref:Uncharacterized protein n=1 Tax=Phytophthora megakarya TaxID=4795 RepID=A0A225WUN5_9STRA|nr:hypothetical protein PHMEG_0004118 [Phytophthora megakarya]